MEEDSIAHAINNPLAVVLANLTFVLEGLASRPDLDDASAPLRGALSDALAGMTRIRAVMDELSSRAPRGHPATVDPRSVLDRAVGLLRAELASATVIRRYEPVPPVGVALRDLLPVLTAVMARASMPSAAGSPPQILLRTSATATGAAIDVITTSHGLAPAVQPSGIGGTACVRVFEDELAALRAAGVSVAFQLTAQGSSARLELPGAVGPARAPAAAAAAAVRARVVVVDDEELVVKVVVRILGAEHEVVGFVDPEVALEHLLTGPRPDVILCDLMMPRLGGADLFERACASHPTLADRFVFLSGGASGARPRAFLAGEMGVVLPKPFTAAALRALVRERADRARHHQPET